jgi:hypothetical protein
MSTPQTPNPTPSENMSKMPLCRLKWFNDDPMYRRIYGILNVENRLPDPCEIMILPPLPVPKEAHERTYGLCWKDRKEIWFRKQPPNYMDFAHELLHLVGGKETELEEVYAYNLSHLVVMLAEKNIIPPVNPVRLFTDVTKDMVVEALREVYRYPFKDLAEYFEMIGVIPPFLKLEYDPAQNALTVKYNPEYDERSTTIMTVTELVAGAEYEKIMLEVVLKLLEKVAERVRK